MQLRKPISNPAAPEAAAVVPKAFDRLRDLITA
jgi:hypothetical protein